MPDGPVLSALQRNALTGVAVGLTDIATVYPLAVLATRRENGIGLGVAVRMGRLHSGAMTAGTLMVPYSVLVECMSQHMQAVGSSGEEGGGAVLVAAAAATAVVATIGVQPIEKKLTMDQMLESRGGRGGGGPSSGGGGISQPMREIAAYTRQYGLRALFGGFTPLLAREFIYIGAITGANPVVTRSVMAAAPAAAPGLAVGGMTAFGVGAAAGIISAPCQTLNAMMKSEVHRGESVRAVLRPIFELGLLSAVHRLYAGARHARRSATSGCCECMSVCPGQSLNTYPRRRCHAECALRRGERAVL